LHVDHDPKRRRCLSCGDGDTDLDGTRDTRVVMWVTDKVMSDAGTTWRALAKA
jgi:hypothetical protein